MGGALVRNAPLRRMVEKTVATFQIETFVETGTNMGITAMWAAEHFKNVVTIEADLKKYQVMQDTVEEKGIDNIVALRGDAGEILPRYMADYLEGPALFWLDAHNTTDRPPIRETLHYVLYHHYDHIIYIDDAQFYWLQCFVDWPTMDELRQMLDGYALALVADAMIAYPVEYGEFLKKIALAERRTTYIPPGAE